MFGVVSLKNLFLIGFEYHVSDIEPKSVVWTLEKKILVDGPTFPTGFRKKLTGHFCSVALNRTHLILLLSFKVYSTPKMVVINFDKQIWYTFNDVNEGQMELCAGALRIENWPRPGFLFFPMLCGCLGALTGEYLAHVSKKLSSQ